MTGHNVLGVANEFIGLATEHESFVTQMHLEKLCYMAHGFTLALLDHPLTKNRIEAWDYGPVYPDLYDALKGFGSGPVTNPICERNWASSHTMRGEIVRVALAVKERRLVETVWRDYGDFQAFQLSALTHEPDSPWAKVYKPGVKNIVIPDRLIKDYFVELTGAT